MDCYFITSTRTREGESRNQQISSPTLDKAILEWLKEEFPKAPFGTFQKIIQAIERYSRAYGCNLMILRVLHTHEASTGEIIQESLEHVGVKDSRTQVIFDISATCDCGELSTKASIHEAVHRDTDKTLLPPAFFVIVPLSEEVVRSSKVNIESESFKNCMRKLNVGVYESVVMDHRVPLTNNQVRFTLICTDVIPFKS